MKKIYCPLCRTAIEKKEFNEYGIRCQLCSFEWLPLTGEPAKFYREQFSGMLGSLALHLGLITLDDLKTALEKKEATDSQFLGHVFVEMELLTSQQLDALLHIQSFTPRYQKLSKGVALNESHLDEKTIKLTNMKEAHLEQTVTVSSSEDWDKLNPASYMNVYAPEPPHPLLKKGVIGNYQVIEELGKGAMGNVFRGKNLKTGKEYAIKVLGVAEQKNNKSHKRFKREAKSIAQLSHPNIVSVFDFGIEDSYPFFVMELVEGKTLKDNVSDRAQPLNKSEIEGIMSQLLSAMSYAHQQNILHRDLKPGNLMLDGQGILKVMDFGLSKKISKSEDTLMETALTEQGVSLGTPLYMSPEQVLGDSKKVDFRSDLYSIGVIFYELLTGELPFQRQGVRSYISDILNTYPQAPSVKNEKVTESWDKICLKSLEKEREKRFQSAAEMLEALGISADTKKVEKEEKQYSQKKRFAFPMIFVILLGITIFLFWKEKQIFLDILN